MSASVCAARGRRFVVGLVLLVAVLAALGRGSPAWAAVAVDAGPADAVLIAPHAFAGANALVAAVEATGARADIAYVPLVVVARADAGQADQLVAAGFTVLRAGDTAPDGAPAEAGRGLALLHTLSLGAAAAAPAAAAPHRAQSGARSPALPDDLRQWRADAGRPPAGAAAASLSAFATSLPSATDVNAYALGTVVVSVVFTQSSGTSPKWPSTENWSNTDLVGNSAVTITDRRAYILSQVDLSLEWWVQRYAENGYSGHPPLTFVVPAAGQPGAPQTIATTIEPIQWSTYSATKPYFSDWLWRRDVMRHLGFPENNSDSPPSERAYDNWLRHQTGADWAITVYCVDSLRDEQTNWGYFKDGSVAYTYDLFGPYVVTSYANDGYGPENYDAVLAHEFGHVFGALDEYAVDDPSYPSGGSLTSGYLGVRNSNAQDGGTTNFPCIMRGGTDSMYAFAHGSLCPSTRGQVGWRDTDKDGDGRPDPVDTHPSIVDQPQADALSTDTVTVTGTIGEVPWPHGKSTLRVYFKHDISILMPHDGRYRLDGGLWQPLAATDGSWDEQTEGFTLTTPSLAPGPHQLQVRSATGETRTLTRTIWVGDVPVSLGLTAGGRRALTITAGQHTQLTVSAVSGGLAVSYLPGVTVGRVGVPAAYQIARLTSAGTSTVGFSPVHTTTYAARFSTSGQYHGAQPDPLHPGQYLPVRSNLLRVGVRAAIIVRSKTRATPVGRTLWVWGTIAPYNIHRTVTLQESRDGGKTWATVGRATTSAHSAFSLRYVCRRRGAIRLRVHFWGSPGNLANTVSLPHFTVY